MPSRICQFAPSAGWRQNHRICARKRVLQLAHGIEIFAPITIFKGVKVYQELRKTNMMLTLESFGYSTEARAKLFREVYTKWDVRERANLKIQMDRQGKHVKGHRNFQPGKSEFTHSDPQRLVDEYAGYGFKWRGDIPGAPGYQEVVNFEEIIGYVDGNPIPTTWGKIHYAKDGVHIVPFNPLPGVP
jgi:hypothetical protein